jgi:hypothetical protein
MNKILMVLPIVGLLGACDTMAESQVAGTLGGAAIGAALAEDNQTQGALIGSAVGLAAGTFLGRTAAGECVYQRQDGSRFIGPCQGY